LSPRNQRREAELFDPMKNPSSLNGQRLTAAAGARNPSTLEAERRAAPAIDYYALMTAAVDRLTRNTAQLRRALYDSAETALLHELRNLRPPIPESDVTHEHLSFHRAIQKVETEWALRDTSPESRFDPHPGRLPTDEAALAVMVPKCELQIGACGATELGVKLPRTEPDPPVPTWLLVGAAEPKGRANSLKGIIFPLVSLVLAGILIIAVFCRPTVINLAIQVVEPIAERTSLPKMMDMVHWGSSLALDGERGSSGPLARNAVIYVEDPADLKVARHTGSAVWRSDAVEDGIHDTVVIHALIEIPEVGMSVAMMLHGNVDKKLVRPTSLKSRWSWAVQSSAVSPRSKVSC
jgi:hypothetical protein